MTRLRIIYRAELVDAPIIDAYARPVSEVRLRVAAARPNVANGTSARERLEFVCRGEVAAVAARLAAGDWVYATTVTHDDSDGGGDGARRFVVRDLIPLHYGAAPAAASVEAFRGSRRGSC